MTVDDDLRSLVRTSVRQALQQPAERVDAALAEFGWRELAATDPALAVTALFEEQGHLAVSTAALDLVAADALGFDGEVAVVWPHRSTPSGVAGGDRPGEGEELAVDGIALRASPGAARPVLVPVGDRVLRLVDAGLDETPLGGMAAGSGWVRVRGRATGGAEVGAWPELERRARLALASELVGVSQRILDVAAAQVSERRQFGRPIGTYQAVRFRLAEAYAEVAGARAFVAAAWGESTLDAARWAKAAAGGAHDAVAKHAMQVCGAIGLSEEHVLPSLVRRGFALDALTGAAAPPAPRAAGPADRVAVGTF